MVVTNETLHSSAALRRIIQAVHSREAARTGWGRLPQWGRVAIRVRESRTDRRGFGAYSGYAYLGGTHSTLLVPPTCLEVTELVALWRHELWHLYGKDHDHMPASIRRCDTKGCGWAVPLFGKVLRP
jgi:hypothetical protein